MSPALSLSVATESPARVAGGNMDRLTTMHPSADDWRFRAAWWRQQARLNEHLEQFERAAVIHENCDAMLAEADRLEGACAIQAPLPDPAPVQPTATVLTLVPKRKAKPVPKVDARQFWALHSAAVSKIAAAYGLAWACDRPEETVNITLPARLRSYRSDRGTLITFRRDWRMPAPAWWPEGRLPDGVDAVPVTPRHEGPMDTGEAWRTFAVRQQIQKDRYLRAAAAARDGLEKEQLWRYWHAAEEAHEDQFGFSPAWPAMMDEIAEHDTATAQWVEEFTEMDNRPGSEWEFGVDVERELAGEP